MPKSESVEITKIKLNLGGKEIELTVEQARNLKKSLDDLFGKEIVREIYRNSSPYWYYYPVYPTYPQITYTYTSNTCGVAVGQSGGCLTGYGSDVTNGTLCLTV
uniref:Uncharacterized protein n=1 Tax=viral metagenome TaxID=1070528 RepID=A0A6M3L7H4_9ZZZZ